MKSIFFYVLFCSGMISCSILDKKPLDMISDADVWNDEGLISLYVNNLYASTPVFTNDAFGSDWHNDDQVTGMFYVNELSDEAYVGWGFWNGATIMNYKGGNLKDDGGLLEYWEVPYRTIRKANVLLEQMRHTILPADVANGLSAEARFIRAFNYFAMVKRYGGVPLVTEVQEMTDSEEELYPARNSEKEIYDFICREMDEIVSDLPAQAPAGKVTKYTALALKSRAALYAGSIARYGKEQLDGLLGFASEEAEHYYGMSYEASKEIVRSGVFALYNAKPEDRSANFRNLFLDEENCECIFVKKYDGNTGGGICWGYDFAQCPKPHAWGAGNQDAPYLEMVESFEKLDGTPGKIDYDELENRVWTMDELWGGRDPRFKATIWTEGTPWKGDTVGFYKGLYDENGNLHDEGSYNGMSVYGSQTVGNDNFFTSFGVMKYLDESSDNLHREMSYSKTDYIVFRLGEIYLNLAEAACELGRRDEALKAVNAIRERAGMPGKGAVDMEVIRHERKVELAFEGHRYWDLRRWRLAEKFLTGGNTGLHYYRVYPDGEDGKARFRIKTVPDVEVECGGQEPLFRAYHYYLPVTKGRTGKNAHLVENPGY